MADVQLQNSPHLSQEDFTDAFANSDEEKAEKSMEWRSAKVANLIRSYRLSLQLVDKLINDQTTEVIESFNKSENKFEDVYDCTVCATANVYVACLNMFPEEIAKTVDVVKECLEFCSKKRKKWAFVSTIADVLTFKTNYNGYTEEEAQTEICYAGLLAMRGILNFIRDNNFYTMVTGAYRLKLAYESFGLCRKLMDHRIPESEELEMVFTQGTKFGVGVTNLLLSHVPKRILKILEFIGFTGNKEVALKALTEGCDISGPVTLGGLLCFATLIGYYLVFKYLLGNGASDDDIEALEPLVDHYIKLYPESAAVHYLIGRLAIVKGECDLAMVHFQKSIDRKTERLTIQMLSIWEMAACNIMKREHRKASQLVRRMRVESNVSKCIFGYMEAAYLLAADDITDEERQQAAELLQNTPDLMAEYCGKHIPLEKFCARKARQYFAQDNFLLYPGYEFLYFVNFFYVLKNNPEFLHSIIEEVEHQLQALDNRKDWQFYPDNYCLARLLQGNCWKYLGQVSKATECFQEIISRKHDIFSDVHLLTAAHLELGMLAKKSGNLEEALAQLKQAKKRRMFWLEFRIHSAKEEVANMLKNRKKSSS